VARHDWFVQFAVLERVEGHHTHPMLGFLRKVSRCEVALGFAQFKGLPARQGMGLTASFEILTVCVNRWHLFDCLRALRVLQFLERLRIFVENQLGR